jgi:hypothetical protein
MVSIPISTAMRLVIDDGKYLVVISINIRYCSVNCSNS